MKGTSALVFFLVGECVGREGHGYFISATRPHICELSRVNTPLSLSP
jgi:hypothetical protein